jgi:hypothetical protein
MLVMAVILVMMMTYAIRLGRSRVEVVRAVSAA